MSERAYNLSGVNDADRLYDNGPAGRQLNPISLAVIEVMVNAGMTEITKNNLNELHNRTCTLSILGMCYIQIPQDDGTFVFRNPLKPELEAHIGMKVSTDRLTERKFYNRLIALVKEAAGEFAATEANMIEKLSEEPEEEIEAAPGDTE